MNKKIKDFFLEGRHTLLIIYFLAALIASIQQYFGGEKKLNDQLPAYTHYNNYIIFKQSFFHLKQAADLYAPYTAEQYDLYKYSPTFALLFSFFAYLPDGLGLLLWNVLNAFALFFGVRMLPLTIQQKNGVLLFALVEMLTSLQNAQSNALIAGLLVFAFALMEEKRFFLACVCISLTVFIKLFGIFAFALCLMYPQRWRMVGYSIGIIIMLALLPLCLIEFHSLISCYHSWWRLLQSDYVPNSLSLTGAIRAWFKVDVSKNAVLLLGLLLFAVPFIRIKQFAFLNYRLIVFSTILVWMIAFNHKAESPTFIIAITGIGLWYWVSSLPEKPKRILAAFALIFTSLSTTDLFPNFIQDNYFDVFSVKAIAPIAIYLGMLYELIFRTEKIVLPPETKRARQ
ncbi:MAG: hypothetical protein OJF59_000411 [Cytophagales bacterium]|jgi:hypothetical protein|nr:DUF2029 domain-containing protein [Bacteroidota bacterium]MBS1982407.1 DUF2029 domain-containing protein [Bacteroidota bacterium]WHZ06658.1 MAG: hypothetical protein OJF59_000411 [Cytophagales bacterium]